MFAIAHLADAPGPRPTVIFLPGYASGPRPEENHPPIEYEPSFPFLRSIRERGWNMVTLMYRGYWGSEGEYSYAHHLEDIGAALAFLRSEPAIRTLGIDTTAVVLVGASMGGGAALLVAGRDDRVRCTAALAPYNLGAALKRVRDTPQGIDGMVRSRARPGAAVQWVAHADAVRDLRDNAERYDLLHQSASLTNHRVMLVAATADAVVPIEDLRELQRTLRDDGVVLTYVELEDDHAFARAPEVLGNRVAHWLAARCGPR